MLKSIEDLENLRKILLENQDKNNICIAICAGTGCRASGTEDVINTFKEELEKHTLADKIKVLETGCHGFCERGPLVVIHPEKIFYQQVKIKDVPEIIEQTIINNNIIDRLLYIDPCTGEKIIYEYDIPFYKKQTRVVLANNGEIDPSKIEDYFMINGYSALANAILKMSYKEVIEQVKKSGLRGRGGAGFPTGLKWEFCRNAKGNPKYIICNADEGDPGAYMDRSILEGNPHSVIEGMIIGAYAIGAQEGYIYVRAEYPLAVKHSIKAIEQAKEYGLLGNEILGTKFNFNIKINKGGGAFVCGEETALIASIEGKAGEPRFRPPYPAESGLYGKPTNINNVETFANIPLIINKGSDWFSQIGTEKSKGTKVFSLVGKVKNTGLIEVPMGITLREIIFEIGGGTFKDFKAVQTGGPSGGCIPESLLDLPVDYEHLQQAGAIMGSGGMIVMDIDNCMVDVAKYFLTFLESESCGKCTPCREGINRMRRILTKITEGEGTEADLELLREIADAVQVASLCALGQTSPNPVLSTLRYFKNEYLAHIKDKKCPAGVCSTLITYSVISENCTGCTACASVCPAGAISGKKKKPHFIDGTKCIKCGACYSTCKFNAILQK